nr:cellulose synthase-like protein G2 isoform X2 [Solanum lycopersicum]
MDRPPYIEVIHDNKESKLPQLVYMSRERRPSSPHRFKAGALNALLRVSGVMSNAPYMLVLDCDMYCNDPSSAKQAMCFHLDHNISTTLSYVQFPQTFYNVSKNDIYDAQSRSAYQNKYQGMDGVGGTVCAGTGYYLKKEALYSTPINQDNMTTLFQKAQLEYKWESQLYQSGLSY